MLGHCAMEIIQGLMIGELTLLFIVIQIIYISIGTTTKSELSQTYLLLVLLLCIFIVECETERRYIALILSYQPLFPLFLRYRRKWEVYL